MPAPHAPTLECTAQLRDGNGIEAAHPASPADRAHHDAQTHRDAVPPQFGDSELCREFGSDAGSCALAGAPDAGLDGLYHYVQHDDVARMQAEGWKLSAALMCPHGDYSVLMQFTGEALL